MLRGPLRLELDGRWLDLGLLEGVARIAASDLERATRLDTGATRCISIENETTLHELAKLDRSDLLIGTSFLGRGTRRLLERLPPAMEFWHFGDSDPAGFAVLADLRERAERPVKALHMTWRPGRTTRAAFRSRPAHGGTPARLRVAGASREGGPPVSAEA